MNAWLSGVDLPGALLQVSLGETPPAQPEGRDGVLTRLGLMGLLDAARQRHAGATCCGKSRCSPPVQGDIAARARNWCRS